MMVMEMMGHGDFCLSDHQSKFSERLGKRPSPQSKLEYWEKTQLESFLYA